MYHKISNKNKKTAAISCYGTRSLAVPPIFVLSHALRRDAPCSLTRKTAALTCFTFCTAAQSPPSLLPSRTLTPPGSSLCIRQQILLLLNAFVLLFDYFFIIFATARFVNTFPLTFPSIPDIIKWLYPGVAQLVARLVRDQEAVGSNPVTRTKNGRVPCVTLPFFFTSGRPAALFS